MPFSDDPDTIITVQQRMFVEKNNINFFSSGLISSGSEINFFTKYQILSTFSKDLH